MSQSETPKLPDDTTRVDFGKVLRDAADPKRIAEFRREKEERRERETQERVARLRADALALFVQFDVRQWPIVFRCPRCTAIVTDPEQHLDWHGRLDEAAAQASSADWRSRPIG